MKIGIPLSDNIIVVAERLAPSFHHTQLLGIFDLENSSLETINLEEENYSGGFTELLNERKISAVISPTYSPIVLKLFKVMNIETLKAEGTDFMMNIESYKDDSLSIYTFEDAREAAKIGCDASAYSSCGSTC